MGAFYSSIKQKSVSSKKGKALDNRLILLSLDMKVFCKLKDSCRQ